MQYIKVTILAGSQETADTLIALLADAGYEGFEEAGDKLLAYIEQEKFNEDELKQLANTMATSYELEIVAPQNWNALWESNFSPVIVDDFCTILADFHDMVVTTPYTIHITPKMSFGTGHHATTQLIMLLMREIDFTGMSVLDFGTGTGVLAILAEKLGADRIVAIDNDMWCVENAGENMLKNNCTAITILQGSLEVADSITPDIILANINRHILLQYMQTMYKVLAVGGTILMSGLLISDESIVKEAALNAGFIFNKMRAQNNWIALSFNKE